MDRRCRRIFVRRAPDSRGGFTLIEMLAVMLILSLLVTFLVTQLGRSDDTAKERLTRTRLLEISAVIDAFERREGDYPASAFNAEQGSLPNALNIGGEALVVALFSKGRGGMGLDADGLDNLDGDQSTKPVSDLPTNDLFEIVDLWGNSIAYFHHADYGRADRYQTMDLDTGELVESEVRAFGNPKTRQPFQQGRYQLISAGVDGRFGTEDDITHFKR